VEPCEIVAHLAVFAFDREGMSFANKPSLFGQPPIGSEVIGCITQGIEIVIKEQVF
jgi:hypothetical protein